jgi:putative transposase
MEVVVVEESYTSKCDHLALEPMCHHDEYMGRRIKRGLFVSSTGKQLNADINGAIGILRKADAVTDAQLMGLRDRGDGVSPRVLIINP